MEKMTYKEALQEALIIQGACNLSGVVFSFARAMQAVCDEAARNQGTHGTNWKNTCPVAILYASKIASLTGCEMGTEFSQAYEIARRETTPDLTGYLDATGKQVL